VENRLIFDSHPLEDVFEEYAFNRLPEEASAEFEEHLLVCPRCQDTLARTDEYILLVKHAAAQWRGVSVQKAPGAALWRSPMVGILSAVLVTAALAIGIPHARQTGEASSVELVALRGGAGPAMAQARAGAPIDIAIDTTDLDDRHPLRIQVVDARGRPVWSGAAIEPAAGYRVSARIDARLAAGVYWIRLYSSTGELLREFGLRAE
jgi:hypothetical protein